MNKMKSFPLTLFLIIGWLINARAQQVPIFSTYIFDPYLYNPSMIAADGYTQISTVHRRQWVDIPNAPITTGINAQIILNPRIALGLNIINDKSILLTNTSAVATFAYRVPFGLNHHLDFGLSAGIIHNSLDINDLQDLSDPALSNLQSNSNVDGQFGVTYSYKNLRVGFALPRLFKIDAFSTSNFDSIEFSELKSKIITLSYNVDVSPYISILPFGQYRFSENNLNYYEAGALVSYKDIIRLGGFYRENVGAGILAQFIYKEKVSFGYAYELSGNQGISIGGASHELQIKVRLGKKSEPLTVREKTSIQEAAVITVQADSQIPVSDKDDLNQSETVLEEKKTEVAVVPLDVKPIEKENLQPTPIKDTPKGYYLVVGSFEIEENANKLLKRIKPRYPNAQIGYLSGSKIHFIYLQLLSENDDISVDSITNIRKTTEFKDAWFMKLE